MNRMFRICISLIIIICWTSIYAQESHKAIDNRLLALTLQPPAVYTSPGPEYTAVARLWQGIPGIERTTGGRLYAVWYSGGDGEGPENYVVVIASDDIGISWSEPKVVIDPPREVRAYDPVLWHDPLGRLWLFWAQSYGWFDGRSGTWALRCDNPDSDTLSWTEPRRLQNGIMMNKPTVLSTGEWLLPSAVWNRDPKLPEMDRERFSNVVMSTDKGETWFRIGGADVSDRTFDEHMIIERRDRSLWMLVRTQYGIGESISEDRGKTWSHGKPSMLPGPNARFFIRRLNSGRILLVNHHNFMNSELKPQRINLTAFLSDDDGRTWKGGLLLDGRMNVSYPDGVEAEDGRIFIIYDRSRHGEKEILMAVFREIDVLAGEIVSDDARLNVLVNKAGALPEIEEEKEEKKPPVW